MQCCTPCFNLPAPTPVSLVRCCPVKRFLCLIYIMALALSSLHWLAWRGGEISVTTAITLLRSRTKQKRRRRKNHAAGGVGTPNLIFFPAVFRLPRNGGPPVSLFLSGMYAVLLLVVPLHETDRPVGIKQCKRTAGSEWRRDARQNTRRARGDGCGSTTHHLALLWLPWVSLSRCNPAESLSSRIISGCSVCERSKGNRDMWI
jgi:hypothetical protein